MDHYKRDLIFIPQDKVWEATAPELSRCTATGNTPMEALQALDGRIARWLEEARQANLPIPVPVVNRDLKGLIALQIPRELHRMLVGEAVSQNVSLTKYITWILCARGGLMRGVDEISAKDHTKIVRKDWEPPNGWERRSSR